jgi:hypothetical protein
MFFFLLKLLATCKLKRNPKKKQNSVAFCEEKIDKKTMTRLPKFCISPIFGGKKLLIIF